MKKVNLFIVCRIQRVRGTAGWNSMLGNRLKPNFYEPLCNKELYFYDMGEEQYYYHFFTDKKIDKEELEKIRAIFSTLGDKDCEDIFDDLFGDKIKSYEIEYNDNLIPISYKDDELELNVKAVLLDEWLD